MVITKQMWAELNAKLDDLLVKDEPAGYFSSKDAHAAYRVATESVVDYLHPHSSLFCEIRDEIMKNARAGFRQLKYYWGDAGQLEKECEVLRGKGFSAVVHSTSTGRKEHGQSWIEVSW